MQQGDHVYHSRTHSVVAGSIKMQEGQVGAVVASVYRWEYIGK